jgi:hypothetical protein
LRSHIAGLAIRARQLRINVFHVEALDWGDDMNRLFVLFFAILLATLTTTCGLFPTSEYIYNFIKGGRHFTGEDFEVNDGKVSLRYPWKVEGPVKVTRDYSYDGSWSLELSDYSCDTSSLSLNVNFEHDTILSFMGIGYSYYPSIYFYIDSSCEGYSLGYYNWQQITITIPSGKHTIEWSNTDTSYTACPPVYIDAITVN